MMDTQSERAPNVSRRLFVKYALAASLIGLPACGDHRSKPMLEASTRSRRNMAATLQRLLPINGMTLESYTELTNSLSRMAVTDDDLKHIVSSARTAFAAASEQEWADLTSEAQVSWLSTQTEESWFFPLVVRAGLVLSEMPALWTLIGYPGSSVEYGGYVERGYNDIDWLPASSAP